MKIGNPACDGAVNQFHAFVWDVIANAQDSRELGLRNLQLARQEGEPCAGARPTGVVHFFAKP
jgi:hypothetical protein